MKSEIGTNDLISIPFKLGWGGNGSKMPEDSANGARRLAFTHRIEAKIRRFGSGGSESLEQVQRLVLRVNEDTAARPIGPIEKAWRVERCKTDRGQVSNKPTASSQPGTAEPDDGASRL